MGKSRVPPGRAGQAESSSRGMKKKKRVVQSDESDEDFMETGSGEAEGSEEDEEPDEGDDLPRDAEGIPIWNKKDKLSSFPDIDQPQMYWRKQRQSKQARHKLFLCERRVDLGDFGRFGVTECFERLGWKENLIWNNNDIAVVYWDQVTEWMATLKRKMGRDASKHVLEGTLGGKPVVLDFEAFKKLGKFDTGGAMGPYHYPSEKELNVSKAVADVWVHRVRTLFNVPPNTVISQWMLLKDNLKMLPRLLYNFVTTNIMPRTSDLNKVRLYDVMVLYALMTGEPVLSARQLIMHNIWDAREKQDKKIIPHARLISALLKKSGVIPRGEKGKELNNEPITFSSFCYNSDWTYELRRTKHRLKLWRTGDYIDGNRSDVEEGEESEEEEEAAAGGSGSATGMTYNPVVTGFAGANPNSLYYSHMQEQMVQARPTEFGEWSSFQRSMYDLQVQQMEEARIFQSSMVWRQEEMRNEDWHYREQIRHDRDYERGWDYSVRPQPTNWQQSGLDPYEVTHQLPRYPQATPSPYVNPYPPQQGEGSSPNDPYDVQSMAESFFSCTLNPPYQPPPYDR